jgi:excisionase family DNA binding protein
VKKAAGNPISFDVSAEAARGRPSMTQCHSAHILAVPLVPRGGSALGAPGTHLTPGAEASVGRADHTDRHRRRAHPVGAAAPADLPDERARPVDDDRLLTVDEVIGELGVSRAAFYRWRRQGKGPATVRLPGGGLRIRRAALRAWVLRSEDTAHEEHGL